jgi:hypothetical protein
VVLCNILPHVAPAHSTPGIGSPCPPLCQGCCSWIMPPWFSLLHPALHLCPACTVGNWQDAPGQRGAVGSSLAASAVGASKCCLKHCAWGGMEFEWTRCCLSLVLSGQRLAITCVLHQRAPATGLHMAGNISLPSDKSSATCRLDHTPAFRTAAGSPGKCVVVCQCAGLHLMIV